MYRLQHQANAWSPTHRNPPHCHRPAGQVSFRECRTPKIKALPSNQQDSPNQHNIELQQVLARFPQGIALLSEIDLAHIQQAVTHQQPIDLANAQDHTHYLPFIHLSPDEAKTLAKEYDQLQLNSGSLSTRKVIMRAQKNKNLKNALEFLAKHPLIPATLFKHFVEILTSTEKENSFDITSDYQHSKKTAIKALLQSPISILFLELIEENLTTSDHILTRLFCQHIQLAYDIFKSQEQYQSLLNCTESKNEAFETSLFIRALTHTELKGLPPNEKLKQGPSFTQFIDGARRSLIPRVTGLRTLIPFPGAIYFLKEHKVEVNKETLKYALYNLAPSVKQASETQHHEHPESTKWLAELADIPDGDCRSLAQITYHELLIFIGDFLSDQETLMTLASVSTKLLQQNSIPSNSFVNSAQGTNIWLNQSEIQTTSAAIENFISNRLFTAFSQLPKERVPSIVRATPSALAVIHQLFHAIGQGKVNTSDKLRQTLDSLTERWIFK